MAVNASNLVTLPAPRTARRILREWVEEATEGKEQVDIEELVTEAQEGLRGDWEFLDALADEAIRDMLPAIARQVLGAGRGMHRMGQGFVTPEEFERRARERLGRWYEHIGDTTHRSLLHMNRDQLLFSAERRERRAEGELRVARFERALAGGLRNEQMVIDRYPVDEVLALWEKALAE